MIALLRILAVVSIYTIWITPFTFVFGLIKAIKKAIRDEEFITEGMISSISLLFMIIPLLYSTLNGI